MHNQSTPVKAAKKQYQKPDFWVLDSYVEGGGGGTHLNETSVLNVSTQNLPAQPGHPGQLVHQASDYNNRSANWTNAHS